MGRYRKRAIEVEAFRIGIDDIPDWFMDKVSTNEIILRGKSTGFIHLLEDTNCDIKTKEGWMHGDYGDYIIRGIMGEIYPCKPEIFRKTYEEVE